MERVCGSNDVCDVVPNGRAHRFGSRPKGDRLSRVLDEKPFSLEADRSHVVRERSSWTRKDARDPSQSCKITSTPSGGDPGEVESPDSADILWV